MKQRVTAISAVWILLFSMIICINTTDALAAQNNGTLITLTQPEQVLDSITYQGITVDAIYTNAAHSGSDPIYSCAAFVKKFYQQIYGVNVYNLHSSVSTPLVYDDKGSFMITETPQVGDIVRDNVRTHWAIVKEVTEDTVTIIQQNYRTGTMAWTDCTVDRKGTGYTFFTYSGRVVDTPLPLAPQFDITSKTLYMGFKDYAIQLEQLSETAQVYYNSDNPAVAVVSGDGIITPIQIGEAIIYIHVLQDNMVYQFQIAISVKEPYIKLSASAKELTVGELITIKVKQYGIKNTIVWKVSNKKIATINEKTGELCAKKQGTVTVTATTDTGLSAKLKIKVI
jgi:hypothetical protein